MEVIFCYTARQFRPTLDLARCRAMKKGDLEMRPPDEKRLLIKAYGSDYNLTVRCGKGEKSAFRVL